MHEHTVLITGGNSGLGLHAAGQIAAAGSRVIITTRTPDKAAQAAAEIREIYGADVDTLVMDLADFASIRQCAADFLDRYQHLHCLINNAGLNLSDRQETRQGFEYVFGVNHLGPFLLTQLLLERLKQSAPSRIICMSSAAHVGARAGIDFDDIQRHRKYSGQAYCQVKLGTLYWVREMAKRYRDLGISAYAINPRLVATQFAQDGDTRGFQKWFFKLGKYWMLKPEEAAKTMVWCATEPGIEELSGQYLQDCAVRKPSSHADNDEAARQWWSLSEDLIAKGRP